MDRSREPIPHPTEMLEIDDQTRSDIIQRLHNHQALRQAHDSIGVAFADGVATLSGIVRTPVHVELAVTTAQATPGVKAVRNELLTDTDIELDAANRLALDPRLRLTTDQVSIASLHGSLLLSGRCDTAEQKAAALEIATYVPGVVEVVDGLKVGPQPPRPIYRRKPAATPTPAKGHH
ncbi:MAG: BON domain-containing protein [Anaerolineae bacterium]